MNGSPGSGNGRLDGFAVRSELSVAALFGVLWSALADLLGTAAAATLLNRAARRAAVRIPELSGLVIERKGLAYRYVCPAGWSEAFRDDTPALREVVGELRPLLIEMTGHLVVGHLEQIVELRERGLFAPQKERQ
jgi:hypothetical protein